MEDLPGIYLRFYPPITRLSSRVKLGTGSAGKSGTYAWSDRPRELTRILRTIAPAAVLGGEDPTLWDRLSLEHIEEGQAPAQEVRGKLGTS